jgi:hypothetical protein
MAPFSSIIDWCNTCNIEFVFLPAVFLRMATLQVSVNTGTKYAQRAASGTKTRDDYHQRLIAHDMDHHGSHFR